MMKKTASAAVSVLIILSSFAVTVHGWGNGGFSDDLFNPRYGTHDWIAHHALDWLPQQEKKYILDNLESFLYGTELPDNSTIPDGVGDRSKHHVYFFANGSLQDDASAVRAREEYTNATRLLKTGNVVAALRRLGMVCHYVGDLAVFGHVMGSDTAWGDETHHSDYEDYVSARTTSYASEFNSYLVFDGFLSNFSAYDAALSIAFDTTFDLNGDLNCTWMDQNYNWSNPAFRNRCGESLNLAVNTLADVLHTFYLEAEGVAHFINVPFHYQDIDYYCGPACLEMVFDYYGEDINQSEIADVARTVGEPIYSTFTDELRRAAHFSNTSTSMGAEMPESITGYTLRKLGYAAFEAQGLSLNQLKSLIDQDRPQIVLMWYSGYHVSTHYRVVTGYNETHVFVHDPWNNVSWGGSYGGPDLAFTNTEFLDLWSYWSNWTLCTSPWAVEAPSTVYVKHDSPFRINVTVTYPQQPPNTIAIYPAMSCNATITLPSNLSLASGESRKKTIGSGFLNAGNSATTSWALAAASAGTYNITVEAEGMISGQVYAHANYTAYNYSDRIGATVNFSIEVAQDDNAPVIGELYQLPEGEVQPDQEVRVWANVTDTESGIRNVTLSYTVDNGTEWQSLTMNYNGSIGSYEATIPGQPIGTVVRFKVVAYDLVGNNATRGEIEPYYLYYVVPEPHSLVLLTVSTIIALAVASLRKKRLEKARHTH